MMETAPAIKQSPPLSDLSLKLQNYIYFEAATTLLSRDIFLNCHLNGQIIGNNQFLRVERVLLIESSFIGYTTICHRDKLRLGIMTNNPRFCCKICSGSTLIWIKTIDKQILEILDAVLLAHVKYVH
jgi:hypothetical protein